MPTSMLVSILAVALALVVGQVLLKVAAMDIAARSGGIVDAVWSPWLLSALAVYGLATCLWVWVLMHVPLSRAYPFALLAMALVPLAGSVMFGEVLTLRYLLGLALVLGGLAVIQSA